MKKGKPDYILLITISILVFFGLAMISSAGIVLSHENFDQPYFYLKNQITKGLVIGLALGFIFYLLPLRYFRKFSFLAFSVNILMLILVFLPGLGPEIGGAKRWLNLGFSFQPTEILKLTLIVYLAAWLEKKNEEIKSFKEGFVPFVFLLALMGALILAQPDIGTFSVIAAIATIIFFVAGANIFHLLALGGLGFGLIGIMIKIYPHAKNRILVFLNPSLDAQGIGYQIKQAIIAIGSGGIFGVGLGQSLQKYKYLPEPVGDSIVAIIGEELGFLGLAFLVCLFGVFIYRGIKIARQSKSKFNLLISVGITSWIGLQASVNIAAISGLAPLTGIPLPFISYGSTALAVSLMGMGLLLNVSKQNN